MIKPEDLKEAMRSWLTGVAIVTSKYGEAVHGMTANSFNSLALDPPNGIGRLATPYPDATTGTQSGIYASVSDIHQIGLPGVLRDKRKPANPVLTAWKL